MEKQVKKLRKKREYTVLLLSAPIGSGHRLAAEALEQQFAQMPHVKVVHGNIFNFFPHFLGSAFLTAYLWILDCCPWMYEMAYKWGNNESGSLWLRTLLNKLLAVLGSSYLNRVKPDAVIATHATPAGIITEYKKSSSHADLWLGAVVTDFTVHRWWLNDGVDTYFLADELLKNKITGAGEVVASGIPVRKQFLNHDKVHCRNQFGWRDDECVCLLMGGGEGLLPMEDIISALQKLKRQHLRLVAVTGHNEKLAAQLRKTYGDALEVYGFREDVPQMMAGADMIITKAGGLTSAEVLLSDLELIVYKPLPGQEQGNAAFLEQYCGAFIARSIDELAQHVAQAEWPFKGHREGKKHAHPLAAETICTYVLDKLKFK